MIGLRLFFMKMVGNAFHRSFALIGIAVFVTVMAIPTSGVCAPPIRFDAPRNFVTGTTPTQVFSMDLDLDGDEDAMVVCGALPSQYHLELFENPGDGTLVYHSELSLAATTPMVLEDLNQDGNKDLIHVYSVGETSSKLVVYLFSGPFSFEVSTQDLPFASNALKVGDLDGLNAPDIVFLDTYYLTTVHSYLGNGDGTFTYKGAFSSEASPRDIDGNGKADLQCSFERKGVVLEDMDGDGDDDILVGHAMSRVFNPVDNWPADPMDMDRCYNPYISEDGSDLVLLRNTGDGSFSPFEVIMDPLIFDQMEAADVDGDGDQDLVTIGVTNGLSGRDDIIVFSNPGNGIFAQAQRFASGGGVDDIGGIAPADIDLDGDVDIAYLLYGPLDGNRNDRLVDHWAVIRNDGTGAFTNPEIYPTGASVVDLVFSQLDGSDGLEALSVASDDHRLSVHYNQAGSYPCPQLISIDDTRYPTYGNTPLGISSGDIDNDGYPDLAIITDVSRLVGDGNDTMAIVYGSENGAVTTPTQIDLQEGPTQLIVEQMAGSNAADIAIAFIGYELTNDPMGIGFSSGADNALPGPLSFLQLNGSPYEMATLDANSDTIKDLAVIRYSDDGITAGVSIVTVDAANGLNLALDMTLGSDDVLAGDTRLPYGIAAADMDGNGTQDLIAVTRNSLGTRNPILSVLLNNGNLGFSLAGEFNATTTQAVTDIIATDISGDGLADIILTTSASASDDDPEGTLEVLRNLGGGVLESGTQYGVGEGPVQVTVAQADGALGPDLIVANDGSNEVAILFNNGGGVFVLEERYLTGGDTDGLTITDLNQDGNMELAVCNDAHVLSPEENHHGSVSIIYSNGMAPVVDVPGTTPGDDDNANDTGDNGEQDDGGGGGSCFIHALDLEQMF